MNRPSASAVTSSPSKQRAVVKILRPSTRSSVPSKRSSRWSGVGRRYRIVQRARHAGLTAQRLRHAEHLVEHRGDDAAVHRTGRSLVRRAVADAQDDGPAVVADLDARRRGEWAGHAEDRAVVEVGARIAAGVRRLGEAFVAADPARPVQLGGRLLEQLGGALDELIGDVRGGHPLDDETAGVGQPAQVRRGAATARPTTRTSARRPRQEASGPGRYPDPAGARPRHRTSIADRSGGRLGGPRRGRPSPPVHRQLTVMSER